MTPITFLMITMILGIVAVTTIDVLGSVTSRKWNYDYSSLTPISFFAYTLIGFFMGRETNLVTTIGTACLVGVYDGTVGWKISILLKANWGDYKERVINMSIFLRLLNMILVGCIFGCAGYFIAKMLG